MSSSSQDLLNPLPYLRVRACYSPHIKGFLKACADNDLATSTHLAPINDTEALSVDLNIAIEGGHVELARQLISQGAKWDSRTIHLASESFQAVEMLLQCGFDANTRLIGGGVLLPMVIQRNDEATVQLLLKHGADPNLIFPSFLDGDISMTLPVPDSGTSLNCAARWGTPKIFELLLSHGAEIGYAIPLHYASGYGKSLSNDTTSDVNRISTLEYLVKLGCDINSKDDEILIDRVQVGTPLQYAVKFRCLEEAKWLLEHGADPDKSDNKGVSAKHRAR